MGLHIYRATRGKYKKPIPILEAKINWIDNEYNQVKLPKKLACEHPKH